MVSPPLPDGLVLEADEELQHTEVSVPALTSLSNTPTQSHANPNYPNPNQHPWGAQAGVCMCFNGVANLETPGTLAVTTRNVRWLHPTGDASKHLRLAFRQISMHAVSRDTSSFPRECIYMQVEGVEGVALPEREGDEDEEEEEEEVTEVHIVPAAPSTRTTLSPSHT